MVIFELTQRSDSFIRYAYYPEGDKSKKPGTIEIDVKAESIYVVVPAELDRKRIATASEINLLRDAINEMRREQGEPDLTEEELPSATEDEELYFYADMAIQRIVEAYNAGTVLEKGSSMWY